MTEGDAIQIVRARHGQIYFRVDGRVDVAWAVRGNDWIVIGAGSTVASAVDDALECERHQVTLIERRTGVKT